MLLIAKCNSLIMTLNKCLFFFFFFNVLCKVSLLWSHFGKLPQQCEVRIPSGWCQVHLKFIYKPAWWRSCCLQNLGVVELTVLCCDLEFTIKRVTHAKSWSFFNFFWLLMIVGTSYAIYLNWIMVPDKVIDGNEACVSSIIMCNQ